MAYTYLLLMPGDGATNPFVIPGVFPKRSYSCAVGSTVSVPDFDAALMMSAGWVNSTGAARGGAGTTAQRPAAPLMGMVFNDSTVGAAVVYLGPKGGWVHHATGASA
jgi:hypothetical protein